MARSGDAASSVYVVGAGNVAPGKQQAIDFARQQAAASMAWGEFVSPKSCRR